MGARAVRALAAPVRPAAVCGAFGRGGGARTVKATAAAAGPGGVRPQHAGRFRRCRGARAWGGGINWGGDTYKY